MQFSILVYCRSGFEGELSKELDAVCAENGVFGYSTMQKGSGFVVYHLHSAADRNRVFDKITLNQMIFARQWIKVLCEVKDLPREDRVSAISESLADFSLSDLGQVSVDYPETSGEEALGKFCRKFTSPLAAKLRKEGILSAKPNADADRLCVFFTDFEHAFVGLLLRSNSSHRHLGIPRLKFPPTAPSRSTLKLEEAWHQFIPRDSWLDYLGNHKKAVDLGAAPGGWTWQLVNQGMHVIAVDNGPMNADLMASGMVHHVQQDGFLFEPPKPVDWLVCDIVDKPRRVADMISKWLVNGWCRYAIFNLKLPMKKRFDEVQACLALLDSQLDAFEITYRLSTKQLYHDREEVTCFVEILK